MELNTDKLTFTNEEYRIYLVDWDTGPRKELQITREGATENNLPTSHALAQGARSIFVYLKMEKQVVQ